MSYRSNLSRIRLLVSAAMVVALGAIPLVGATADEPTYSKDIAPILQRSCQRCHNPNSVAPMSLLTYQQVRPFAKEIKRRTALKYAPWSRGVMPPWFLETNIGIQHMKDDVSLNDAEIAMIGKWADSGAPEGNPADAPKPISFPEGSTWSLGKPDLIVSSPTIYIGSVASDWAGGLGKTPIGNTEDRYAASAEYMEVNNLRLGKIATIGARWVFHHAVTSILGPDEEGDTSVGEAGGGDSTGRLPIHETGRNGDVFPPDSGLFLPANGFIGWDNLHVHAAGAPGLERTARMDVGIRLHPLGYKPSRDIKAYTFGRTEIQVNPMMANQREDAYFVAPQAMKLINYEPHLHENGVRMCLEAVYGKIVETLNCAGYDHNWVRNYYYEENSMPLIPKGTILHAIAYFDNTPKNENVLDPRNVATWGNSAAANMFVLFNFAEYLTDEQYQQEVAKRKEYLQLTKEENIGCPACYLPAPKAPAPKPATPAAAIPAPKPAADKVVAQN